MQDAADPLAQLHDILLPAAPGWWPLAPGWWLLIIVLLSLIAFLLWRHQRQKNRNRYRQEARAEMQHLLAASLAPADFLQACSVLLRRTALTAQPVLFPVDIQGDAWLKWLEQYAPSTAPDFTQGIGRELSLGLYRASPSVNQPALAALIERWIVDHQNQWQKPSKKIARSGVEVKSHA